MRNVWFVVDIGGKLLPLQQGRLAALAAKTLCFDFNLLAQNTFLVQ